MFESKDIAIPSFLWEGHLNRTFVVPFRLDQNARQ